MRVGDKSKAAKNYKKKNYSTRVIGKKSTCKKTNLNKSKKSLKNRYPAVKLDTKQDSKTVTYPSLVLIQIDGLGFRDLNLALSKGYVPNLKKLIDRGWKSTSIKTGVPTITTAAQSAVFYGRFLPGNEWYDRVSGIETSSRVVEAGIPKEAGLLSGGGAYVSALSGGASRTAGVYRVLCEDAKRFCEVAGAPADDKVGKIGAVLKDITVSVPLLIRWFVSRDIQKESVRVASSFVSDVERLSCDFEAEGINGKSDLYSPYILPMIDHLLSPIAEQGILESLQAGDKVIYTDLAAYDEESHYYGPSSPQAYESLRRIDEHVGRIVTAAEKAGANIVIFSDHGQTSSINFKKLFKTTVQQVLDNFSGKPGELVFSHVYSMGNIYVKDSKKNLTIEQVEQRFPGLVDKLLAHSGFGIVAARRADGSLELRGRPLSEYADDRISEAQLEDQIANYLAIPGTGDLVVFSPFIDGKVIDYNEDHVLIGSHGGIGGEQMHPFLLYDQTRLSFNTTNWIDMRELHHALKNLIGPVPVFDKADTE